MTAVLFCLNQTSGFEFICEFGCCSNVLHADPHCCTPWEKNMVWVFVITSWALFFCLFLICFRFWSNKRITRCYSSLGYCLIGEKQVMYFSGRNGIGNKEMSCRNLTSGDTLNCQLGCCSLDNGNNSCCELRNFFMHGIVIFGAFCFFICLICFCYRWKKRRPSNSDQTPILRADVRNQTEPRSSDQTAHNTAVDNDAPPTYSAVFGNQEVFFIPTEQSEGNLSQHRSGQNNVNNDNTETSTTYIDEIRQQSRVYALNNVVINNKNIVSNSDDPPDYATYVREHGMT